MAGWREWVRLPALSPVLIHAKLDTGAQTSALHAFRMKRFTRAGERWVRFDLYPRQKSSEDSVTVELPIIDERRIRSSDGRMERRPVIKTKLELGRRTWEIEVTLTRRDAMSYRLLVGRTAMRRRIIVDPGRSHLAGH